MKVLVTGGAGFIGSHTAAGFLRRGWDVTVLDDLSTGTRGNVPAGCAFVEGDVRDTALVSRHVNGHDLVVHLAAFTSVPGSFEFHVECFEVNFDGLLNVIDASLTHGVQRIVFASSSAVYAEEPDVPKQETDRPEPTSPYAVSKLEGEHLLGWFRRRGLESVALRYFNVFGPRQNPDSDYAAVVPIFMENALADKDLVINGDGKQTRDFVYVDDVVRANINAATVGSGVYNVGTATDTSVKSLAQEIITLTGSTSTYRHAPRQPGDILHSRAEIMHISRELGWTPHWSLRDGLDETMRWHRDDRPARTDA